MLLHAWSSFNGKKRGKTEQINVHWPQNIIKHVGDVKKDGGQGSKVLIIGTGKIAELGQVDLQVGFSLKLK